MTLAARIRTLRKAAGKSQAAAAEAVGWDRTTWVNYECDRPSCRNPTMVTLDMLARGIGVTLPVLMDGVVVVRNSEAAA